MPKAAPLARNKALHLGLPWTDPRCGSEGFASAPFLDLGGLFWAYLRDENTLAAATQRARHCFRDLDSRDLLTGSELRALNNAARTLALLDSGVSRKEWGDWQWDELLCRLSDPEEGWLVRLDRAIPYPGLEGEAFLGRPGSGLLGLFRDFLAASEMGRRLGGAKTLVLELSELGQLPFAYLVAQHLAAQETSLKIELWDRSGAGVEGLIRDAFAAHGVLVLAHPKARDEIVPVLAAAQLKKKLGGKVLRVSWRPSIEGLVSGRSAKKLAAYAQRLASARVQVALLAQLPVLEDDLRAEGALFAGFDALGAVQYQLASLQVHVYRVGAAPADDWQAWQENYQFMAGIGDICQDQVHAELDKQELGPHKQRREAILAPGARLRTAPGISLRSRYPLDALSDADPPNISWPFSYGRQCAQLEAQVPAAARRKSYRISAGGRLIFSQRSELAVLDYFTKPRPAARFLKELGAKRGVEVADLESLVSEGILLPESKASRGRKAARKGKAPSGAKAKGGYLHLVGIGPGGGETVSSHTIDAIAQAEELWIQDLGLPGFERTSIRDALHGQKIINTVHYYGTGHMRTLSRNVFYEMAARRAIDMATKGRQITMVFSGSPVVWVEAYSIARHYLQEHPDFDLRLTNAMSFLDTVFVPTPIGGIRSLQLRGGSLTNPDVSPEIDCILGQVGDTGQPQGVGARPETITETLQRLYPADHPIYVVGNDEINSDPLYVESTASEVAEILPEFARWYLCLVIPSLKRATQIRNLADDERKRKMLGYLWRV